MARPTSANQQQAANRLPSVGDIFRVYVLSRLQADKHRRIEISLNFSSLKCNLQKGIKISLEEQKNCLQGLNTLNLEDPLGYSKLFLLCDMMAGTFENGEINWTKILFVLDSIVNMIERDRRNVFLVDHLCHYCETVCLSSTGQSLSEWINQEGKEVLVEKVEILEDSSSANTKKNSKETERKNVAWARNCSCGAEPEWSIKDGRKCSHCQKYPCPIDGCKQTVTQFRSFGKHFTSTHNAEEQAFYKELLHKFKSDFCRCGERISHGGNVQYVECLRCGIYICLKGECTTKLTHLHHMVAHQHYHCKFRHLNNPHLCINCGGQKAQDRATTQQCPNSNCRVFWCPLCIFEGKTPRSVNEHISKMHRKVVIAKTNC